MTQRIGRRTVQIGGDRRGNAMLETALALLLALPPIFWVFEISMYAYSANVITNAAQIGVRYAIVHGVNSGQCSGPGAGADTLDPNVCGDPDAEEVVSIIRGYAAGSLHDATGMVVRVSYPDGLSAPPSRVVVNVYDPYVPYLRLPGIPVAISASAEGRIVY